jgi:hypothetical protein
MGVMMKGHTVKVYGQRSGTIKYSVYYASGTGIENEINATRTIGSAATPATFNNVVAFILHSKKDSIGNFSSTCNIKGVCIVNNASDGTNSINLTTGSYPMDTTIIPMDDIEL